MWCGCMQCLIHSVCVWTSRILCAQIRFRDWFRSKLDRLERISTETGAVLLQFSLTLPILLAILGAIVNFGMALRENGVLAAAARAGARAGASLVVATPDLITFAGSVAAQDFLDHAGLDRSQYFVTVCRQDIETSPGGAMRAGIRVELKSRQPRHYLFGDNLVTTHAISVFVTESGDGPVDFCT